jgi:hypothetical protein
MLPALLPADFPLLAETPSFQPAGVAHARFPPAKNLVDMAIMLLFHRFEVSNPLQNLIKAIPRFSHMSKIAVTAVTALVPGFRPSPE